MSLSKEEVLNAIAEMSVMDVVGLVSDMEEKFGVSAASAVASGPVSGVASAEVEEVEEQTEFDILLSAIGEKKVNVIKVVRSVTGLGLKEAKAMVDGCPSTVKEAASKSEAEDIKKQSRVFKINILN